MSPYTSLVTRETYYGSWCSVLKSEFKCFHPHGQLELDCVAGCHSTRLVDREDSENFQKKIPYFMYTLNRCDNIE